MSFFFKRNKDVAPVEPAEDVAEPVAEPVVEPQPAPEPEEPDVTAPKRTSEMVKTREGLIQDAYDSWHTELASRVMEADKRDEERAPGRIDLTQIHPTGSVQFYAYQATRLSSLIREERSLAQARTQLTRLRNDLDVTAQKYGHAPASVSVGALSWTELPEPEHADFHAAEYATTGELHISPEALLESYASDNETIDENPYAHSEPIKEAYAVKEPALFRPVRLFFHSDKDALVQLVDSVEINPVVIRALRNHGAAPEELAALRQLATEGGSADVLITRITELGRIYLPGFGVEPKVILGSFFQPERTMLTDLESMEPYIRASGVMLALAGDLESRDFLAAPLPAGNPKDRDPEAERGIGDQDVAELDAVEAVAAGKSIVVDCPPGSKRASVMAAIAADTVASGRSMMVVPSRSSSANELVTELEKRGLGDLVADFSDVESIPMRIRTGMRIDRPELPTEETLERRNELMQVRSTLETFMSELHDVNPKWGVSVYDLLQKLAAATGGNQVPLTKVRFDEQTLESFAGDQLEKVKKQLEKAGEHHAFDSTVANSAWTATRIDDPALGNQALDAVRRLHDISLPATVNQSSRAAGETGLVQANTLAEWGEQIDVLDGISESLDIFLPQVFETSAMNMVIATATREWRDKNGHTMRGSDRRRYKKQAQDLIRPGAIVRDLHAELALVQSRRDTWRRYTAEGGWPQLPDGLAQMRSTHAEVVADVEFLSEQMGGEDFFALSFGEFQARLAALAADAAHMAILPERNVALKDLRERGLDAFVADMHRRNVSADHVLAEFDLAYASSVFEQLIVGSQLLANLGPRDLERLLVQFRELDVEHCDSLAGPVKLAVVNNARALMIERKNDTLKLDSLLSRHGVSVLRDVIATYQRLVQVARPVWIVPATIAAEFIPPMPWVDVVVMDVSDGASVASVVSSLVRGRQIVLVGDVRRARLVERENGVLKAFSTILPVCELPTHRAELDDLSLRALRSHGYDDVLPRIPATVSHKHSRVVVVDGRGVPSSSADGAIESPKVEVDAVVEAVLEHAMERPHESLAVITVSATHAHRVREALRHIGTDSSELSVLYEGHQGEPFVVLDMLSAAGVRRDHVILSVGYGKTVHGRVLHSFGSLATPAGLTGLIDAIEAARGSMTIVSSIAPGEISFNRVSTPGPRLLAELLLEADGDVEQKIPESGGEVVPLLADLARRIEAAGYSTRANVGDGEWHIPLVVGHPDIPGEWVVAVLFDDDVYSAQCSLRRRDRYRIQVLEQHGWSVYQTFSTSLFVDPQGQAQRVMACVDAVRERLLEKKDIVVPHVDEWGEPEEIEESHPEPEAPLKRERTKRPMVIPGLQLAGYTDNELEELVEWIASDGVVRSIDEYVEELRSELALRRGSQIDRVLANIVRRVGVAHND